MKSRAFQTGAVVLLSGGIDSAACVKFLLNQGIDVHALNIDYGQGAATEERSAASAIASHYRVPLTHLRCDGSRRKAAGLILGRNNFLVFTALVEISRSLIAIGIHSGTRYWDCSPQFLGSTQVLIDGCTDGRVQLVAPFLTWTKRQIWDFCKTEGVPLGLTYSCEAGGSTPCGRCLSCLDKEALSAG